MGQICDIISLLLDICFLINQPPLFWAAVSEMYILPFVIWVLFRVLDEPFKAKGVYRPWDHFSVLAVKIIWQVSSKTSVFVLCFSLLLFHFVA